MWEKNWRKNHTSTRATVFFLEFDLLVSSAGPPAWAFSCDGPAILLVADFHFRFFQWILMAFFFNYYFTFYFIQESWGQFRLAGPSGGLQSNLLLKAGSATRSGHITQGFIQLGLENAQGRRPRNLSGQPALPPDCPCSERFSSFPVWTSCCNVVPCPPIGYCCVEPGAVFSISSPKGAGAAVTCPRSHLFPRLGEPRSSASPPRGSAPGQTILPTFAELTPVCPVRVE